MAISVTFSGLCGIGVIEGTMQAAMPSVEQHQGSIVVNAEMCDLDRSSAPQIIFNNDEGVQFVVWIPEQGDYRIAGGNKQAEWQADARERIIDLADFHPGAKLKRSESAIMVLLSEGTIAAGRDSEDYQLLRDGHVVAARKTSRLSVVWSGNADGLMSQKDKSVQIILRDGASAFVSNLAHSRDSDHHFMHYYHELFATEPGNREQITIKRLGRLIEHVHVFDCVPPIALP
jgi:hypothetical protein